jgi:1-deoxyxylulose-5-phosphate synthase
VIARLNEMAAARNALPATLALAWLLGTPAVVAPILGFSSAAQIDVACEALNVALTPAERASLEAPYRPHGVIGFELEGERV